MQEILDTRVWALESFFLQRAKAAIFKAMEAGNMSSLKLYNFEKAREAKGAYTNMEYDDYTGGYIHRNIEGKNIAHIPVVGSLTKRGGLCTYGAKDYIRRIEAANNKEDYHAIMLEIDGPGGSVDGTEELGAAIAASEKPVVVWVDGMAASAHYWLASQATEIVVSSEITSWIGSIGTLVVHVNQEEWLAQNGLQVEIIRAPQSKDKARENSFEPLSEESRVRLLDELSDITELFISKVKEGRGDRLNTGDEDIFTGKVYNGKKALEMGMVDCIGRLSFALQRASQLSQSNSFSNQNNRKSMSLKDWFSGKKSEENANGETVTVEASELNQLRADMEAAIQEREQAQTDLEAAQTETARLTAEKGNLEMQLKAAQDKIAVLEKKPDVDAGAAGHTGDQNGGEGEKRKLYSWEEKAARKKSLKSQNK